MFTKIILSAAVLLGCVNGACINENDPEGITLTKGDHLPDFSIILNSGEVVSTASLQGKVSFLVFFNTSCSDCQKELPIIQQVWEEYQDNPEVMIAAISREENAESIENYWEKNGLTIPWSAQENRDVYSLFAPSVIPRIYIANKKGIITFTSDDSDMPDLNTLISAIQESF